MSKKIISILLTFVFVISFMTGCSAAEQTKEETEKFVLTMQIGNPVMTVNGENKNIDDCYTRITNAVRDNISPDIAMFTKYAVNENDRIIEITVSEGTNKPYFIKSKGMRPEGVYVRHGASSAPAPIDKIRQMIKLSEKESFEEERALNQELHFTEAK